MKHYFCIKTNEGKSLYFNVTFSGRGLKGINFRSAGFGKKTYHSCIVPNFVKSLEKNLARYLKGKKVDFESIPLDFSGAAGFYRKVWKKLMKIKPGRTVTYGELALICGDAKAARAVGNAMNKNPFPILVPCHRVIAKNGSLGGYSKGLRLKKMFLALEGNRLFVDKVSGKV